MNVILMMKIINFMFYQTAWFVTIFSAANGKPYIGVLFTLIWMIAHLSFIKLNRDEEVKLLVFSALLGYILESLLVITNIVSYPEQAQFGMVVPFWMVALWINLAATINFSLSWLKTRYVVASLLGAIAGPLAYSAGAMIGAITINSIDALIIISIMWAVAMPLLFWISTLITYGKKVESYMFINETE